MEWIGMDQVPVWVQELPAAWDLSDHPGSLCKYRPLGFPNPVEPRLRRHFALLFEVLCLCLCLCFAKSQVVRVGRLDVLRVPSAGMSVPSTPTTSASDDTRKLRSTEALAK